MRGKWDQWILITVLLIMITLSKNCFLLESNLSREKQEIKLSRMRALVIDKNYSHGDVMERPVFSNQ